MPGPEQRPLDCSPRYMAAQANAYERRPWLSSYEDLPSSLEPTSNTGLSMFQNAIRRAGDTPLLRYFNATMSGEVVDRISGALAGALKERGVLKGDRIAIYLQNVPQFVLTVLAAWKVGAVVVPCNPMFKYHELGIVFRDSTPKALVSDAALFQANARVACRESSVQVVVTTSPFDFLDQGVPAIFRSESVHITVDGACDFRRLIARHQGQDVPDPELTPDDIAFLVYTSGTTGPPKAAMNLHRNVAFTSAVFTRWMSLGPDDGIFALAPLFHITGLIAHIGAALDSGAELLLAYRFEAGEALSLIERYESTFTIGAITGFIAMLEHPTFPEANLSSLRKVYSGGAPVPAGVIAAWQDATGTYIHNGYGLTESTTATHLVPLGTAAPVDPDSGAVSIGIPVFDTMAEVVSADGCAVSPGSIGEIVISGPGVVPGYWQNEAETASVMLNGRLRTGDIGLMDENGWFYVVDRKKDQINAAGYKVWPREVEDVLYKHPAVREVGVIGVADKYRGETVKAFVSLKEGASTTASELIAFCRDRLAAYKYPRQVEFLDELPKTPTGKVLRRELRER